MLDITRLALATIYVLASLIFASPRSWAEEAEHGILIAMLALAAGALMLSGRSWVIEMRIRKPVVLIDAVLFLALLIVTNPASSPYFPGCLFVAVETALIVRRRLVLLAGLFMGLLAVVTLWGDELARVPAEPESERIALRLLYLVIVIAVTGALLGPRREKVLERERNVRLADAHLPPTKDGAGEFLIQALKSATDADDVAVLFRPSNHDRYHLASSRHGDALPQETGGLLAVETAWHDRRRGASISQSPDGASQLHPLARGGEAWCDLLGGATVMTIRVSLGTFQAVGAAQLDDPRHEDALAIAQRLFEGACEELMIRNSLDLAHAIAGARERERLQRELHDSVLQALASIRFQVAPLLNGAVVDPRPVVETVDRIAKDQIATIRHIINPEVDEEDFAYLPETLGMVVRSLGDQWGIRCTLYVDDGNCSTSAMIGRELSFAVREIVANAVRHAKARAVEFSLRPEGNRIALQVTDDGVPNLARLGSSGAVPSRSLMRRVQALGGEVFLRSLGGRTMIQITVPRK